MRVACLIFPSMHCVCISERKSVWVHICIHARLRYRSVKKVTEEWVQERQTAKQHQMSYFSLVGCETKKKN